MTTHTGSARDCEDPGKELQLTEPLDTFPSLRQYIGAVEGLQVLRINAPFGKVRDLSFLAGAPRLRVLDLRARPLDDIKSSEGLQHLKYLEELSVNAYLPVDLRHVISHAMKKVELYAPRTTNLHLLGAWRSLESVHIQQYSAPNLMLFRNLSNLRELRITGGRVSSADGLSSLTALHTLAIIKVGLMNADSLGSVKSLRRLDLSSNPELKDIGFIEQLPDLAEYRMLSVPRIRSYRPLLKCTQLVSLEVSAVPDDGDLNPLRELRNLKKLFVPPRIMKALESKRTEGGGDSLRGGDRGRVSRFKN